MATATDKNLVRRSVYQNSNTLVEVLIKSKEPAQGRGRGRGLTQTAPAWPAAVPVRKDGRPVSLPTLPSRPRAGRRLPAWQQTAPLPPPGQQRRPGELGLARGGRQGTQHIPDRQQTVGSSVDPGGDGSEPEQQFQQWTRQLNRLVQEIKHRPATAHLRPLLTRLEETVREPPPLQQADDQLLRSRLEQIQRENEELQSKFQSLSASMHEYRRTMTARPAAVEDSVPPTAAAAADGTATELADVKRQLAKYRKYASKLTKTKENLLTQIETMEQQHASELKSLREEHESQISQVLAQVTSETEILGTFKSDAEAVQRSLEQHVRENATLQRTLADRDEQIRRLTELNRTLQQLGQQQLQWLSGSQLPSLGQLATKLQSPSAGGATVDNAPDGGGDRRPGSGHGRDASINLDVTVPAPPRPFPGPDLSLCSLVSFAPLPADVTGDAPPLPDGTETVQRDRHGEDEANAVVAVTRRTNRGGVSVEGLQGRCGPPDVTVESTLRPGGPGGDSAAGMAMSEIGGGVAPDQDFLRSVAWLSERLAGLQGEVSRAVRSVPSGGLMLSP